MSVLAHGEDRSNHQPVGPWTGLQFGFFKLTEALDFVDVNAQQNYENCLRDGVIPAAYHFLHPNLNGVEQAQFFLTEAERFGMTTQNMGFACDCEILVTGTGLRMAAFSAGRSHLLELDASGQVVPRQGSGYPESYLAAAPQDTNQCTAEFMGEVVRQRPWHHRELYTTISIGDTLKDCGQYPLWLAYPALSIPRMPIHWKNWTFWQFAWSGGFANCDRDVFNGTALQLAAWVRSFVPEPVPPLSEEDDMGQLATTNGGQDPIPFPPGSAHSITFLNDCHAQNKAAPGLRVAVHSHSKGWSQLVSALTLPVSAPYTVKFDEPDADGVAVTRLRQSHEVAVGFVLEK